MSATDFHSSDVPGAVTVNDPLPAATGYLPPSPPSRLSGCGYWSKRMALCVVFHIFNAGFGITMFCVVVCMLPLSLALLPLCCVGIIIFQLLSMGVELAAQLDVFTVNQLLLLAAHRPAVHVHPSLSSGLTSAHLRSVCGRLLHVNPRNLLVMAYFATINFALAISSCIVMTVVIGMPIAWCCAPSASSFAIAWVREEKTVTYRKTTRESILLPMLAWIVIGVAGLPLVAVVSRKCTEWCCSEWGSTANGNTLVELGYSATTSSPSTAQTTLPCAVPVVVSTKAV